MPRSTSPSRRDARPLANPPRTLDAPTTAPREAPATTRDRATRGAAWHGALAVAAALAAAVLLAHVWSYRAFLADDALISLRYARRLLGGHGLTWTEGPRVEGYSNLLWILIVAAPGALGLDLVKVARGLGVALVALAWAIVVVDCWRRGARLGAVAGGLAIACAGPIAVWAGAGLEPPLVAALLAWAIAAAARLAESEAPATRAAWRASLPLAMLALTRPDGTLFTAAIAAGIVVARGLGASTRRTLARFVTLPLLAVAMQLVFRLAYYHAWVPNSARVKIAFAAERAAHGYGYLAQGFSSFWPFWLLAAIGAIAGAMRPETRARAWIALAALAAWIAYVIAIGGDFFPGYRHLVPAMVAGAFLVALAVEIAWRSRARAVAPAASFALLLLFGWRQLGDPENARARRETWVWDGRAIGAMLERAFGESKPLIAVVSAGCFPYESELPALDMLGLNDSEIPGLASPEFGKGWAGHELGDAGYVLRRRPDIVQFSGIRHSERTGYFRVEQDLARSPAFQSRYVLATFEARGGRTARQPLWLDRESARLGFARVPGRVRLPAILFAGNPASTVTLDDRGRAVVEVAAGRPAMLEGLALGKGDWSIAIEGDGALRAGIRPAGSAAEFVVVEAGRAYSLDRDSRVDLLVGASDDSPARARAVTLVRAVD